MTTSEHEYKEKFWAIVITLALFTIAYLTDHSHNDNSDFVGVCSRPTAQLAC